MSEAIAANFGPMNYQHEAEPVAEANLAAAEAPQRSELARKLRYAGAIISSVVAFGGAAGTAEASDTGTPVVGTPEVTGTVAVAKSSTSVESLASGKVVILGNMMVNGLPKKQIRKLEKEGKCKIVDGSEEDVWTQGRQEKGKPYGKDTRTSEFCKVNGKWVRVACGNDAKIKEPKKNVVKAPIIWVKNYAKAKMTLNAKATAKAEAYCKTPFTYAYSYGFGESSASVSASVKMSMKAKGKGYRKVVSKIYGQVSGEASAKAKADAYAECHDQGGTVVPKDGTQGPGSNIPTQPGGPGAGGEAGDPNNGEVCRNEAGDIVTGTPDQMGNC